MKREQLIISYVLQLILEIGTPALAWYFYDWHLALVSFLVLWAANNKQRLVRISKGEEHDT